MPQQSLKYIGAKVVGALDDLASFLQRLTDADFAEKLQCGTFGRGNQRRVVAIFEAADVQRPVELFIEEPLAMVLAGKLSDEPIRQMSGYPSVQVQDALLRNVVAHAIPFQRRLPAEDRKS